LCNSEEICYYGSGEFEFFCKRRYLDVYLLVAVPAESFFAAGTRFDRPSGAAFGFDGYALGQRLGVPRRPTKTAI